MPFDGIVTKAAAEELHSLLTGGRINKIYQPSATELVLTIRSQGRNHDLLMSIHPNYARIHITAEKYTNPQEPPMFCMVLRKHLTGAGVLQVRQHGMERMIVLELQARNEIGDLSTKELIIELMGKHSNILLVDQEKQNIIDSIKHVSSAHNRYRTILPGHDYILPPEQDKADPLEIDEDTFIRLLDFNEGRLEKQIARSLTGFSSFIAADLVKRAHLGAQDAYKAAFDEIQKQIKDRQYDPAIYRSDSKEDFYVLPLADPIGEKEACTGISAMLDAFFRGKAERDRVRQQAKDLYRFIKNEKEKNERKLIKQEKTVKRAENADSYQRQGELLTAHLHLVKQGDQSVTVTDYYDPDQNQLKILLDPLKSPSENAQSFFKTYQKLKTSKQVLVAEMEKTKAEISYLESLLQQIDSARVADLEEIREELQSGGYIKRRAQHKHKNKPSKPQPEQFTATDGTMIYVGKNNTQNDYLTNRIARRDEIWLHAKDIPGSHVIIRAEEPSADALKEAALLAAYYSKSRESSSVPVDYTKVRHVKKPSGAKPGFVTYDNQKTLYVTPDERIIQKMKQPGRT